MCSTSTPAWSATEGMHSLSQAELRKLGVTIEIFIPSGSFNYPVALLAGVELPLDPFVGLSQTIIEFCVRLPFESLPDESIVAVPASDAPRRAEVIVPLEFDARDLLDLADQVI